jgi:hypothetical protein
MNQLTLDSIVPRQNRGRKARAQISANCDTIEAADRLYEFLKVSLADINNWDEFKPGISFRPKLTNKSGQILQRMAQTGDLIKIMLPRWQPPGKLYDWRKITRIEERLSGHTEIFFMTITPAISPEMDVPEASHFLRPESTVTFFVVRDEHKLELEIHTRNEAMNFQLSGFKTKLQSAMMGVFIAGGFYEAQWTRLLKSILKYGLLQMKITN